MKRLRLDTHIAEQVESNLDKYLSYQDAAHYLNMPFHWIVRNCRLFGLKWVDGYWCVSIDSLVYYKRVKQINNSYKRNRTGRVDL